VLFVFSKLLLNPNAVMGRNFTWCVAWPPHWLEENGPSAFWNWASYPCPHLGNGYRQTSSSISCL
jgi:hypothetical protein